jgi:hypothetical protein
MLQKALQYSPLFAIAGFFYHYIFLYMYYTRFGIDILLYSDFSEILTRISTWLVIPVVFGTIFFRLFIIPPEFNAANFIQNLSNRKVTIILRVLFILFCLLSITSNIIRIYGNSKHSIFGWLMFFSTIGLFIIATIFILRKNSNFKASTAFIGILIISLTLLVTTLARNEINKILYSKQTLTQTSFKYHDRYFTTDSVNKYIGQTRSAIFIYNRQTRMTTVYKMENIDSLVFKATPILGS